MNSRKSAIAVLIAVLLTGCLIGALGFWLWRNNNQGIPYANGSHGRHDPSIRIFSRLQLTPEQKNKLQEILDDSRRQINDCQEEMQDKMSNIRTHTNERISSILDEDQKSMFERLLIESESHGGEGHHDRSPKTRGD